MWKGRSPVAERRGRKFAKKFWQAQALRSWMAFKLKATVHPWRHLDTVLPDLTQRKKHAEKSWLFIPTLPTWGGPIWTLCRFNSPWRTRTVFYHFCISNVRASFPRYPRLIQKVWIYGDRTNIKFGSRLVLACYSRLHVFIQLDYKNSVYRTVKGATHNAPVKLARKVRCETRRSRPCHKTSYFIFSCSRGSFMSSISSLALHHGDLRSLPRVTDRFRVRKNLSSEHFLGTAKL